MSASVTTTGPGAIEGVGNDWTIKLDAMPHSPLVQNGSTGEVDFSTRVRPDTHLVMNNQSTFTYSSETVDADPGVNVAGTIQATTLASPIATSLTGTIDSVSIVNKVATITQGTPLTQFATTDLEVPWVSSGSVLAALDIAWQLAGNKRCTLNLPTGRYWSLRGHDTCFDRNQKVVYPSDHSTYQLTPTDATQYYRSWDLRDSYASTQWAYTGSTDDLYSYRGVGSSPSVAPGTRTSIAFTTTNASNTTFNYGHNAGGYSNQANGYAQQYGFGLSTGYISSSTFKTMAFTLSQANKNASFYYTYINPGAVTQPSISGTIDLSGLNWAASDNRLKIVTDTAWVNSTTFLWSLWFQDTLGNVVSWNSGNLTTNSNTFAKPWDHIGSINGLYQVTQPLSFDPSTLLANYENSYKLTTSLANNTDNGGLPPFGSLAYEPILPFTGTLWDYLCQVFTAKEMDLRIVSGGYVVTKQSEQITTPLIWSPIASPTFAIDNQNLSNTVEIDAQLVTLGTVPIVYDARPDGNQVYSVNAGETTTFKINSAFIGSSILNPEPVTGYSNFANYTPLGGFIVTGTDNLPVSALQWVTQGGQVYVTQTGPKTLSVTVNCPQIWDANTNNDGGQHKRTTNAYIFGVSDGQNQYGTFALAAQSGSTIKPVTMVFQTGASYAAGNSSPGAISNPCATSYRMVNTLAAQASWIASGPNLTLTGSMPIDSLTNTTDFGYVPASTFFYRNIQWRMTSVSIQKGVIGFTAVPFMTYNTTAWGTNWSNRTVDDFKTFWQGKTYDDMKTMALSGPIYDWTEKQQTTKYTVFPGNGSAGEVATYPGAYTYPGGDINAD